MNRHPNGPSRRLSRVPLLTRRLLASSTAISASSFSERRCAVLKVSHDISLAPSDARPCMYRRTSPIPDEPAAGAPLREVIKNRVTGLMGLSSVQYNPPNKTDCVPTEVCRYRKRRLQGEVRSPHVTFPPPSFHPFALPDTHTHTATRVDVI